EVSSWSGGRTKWNRTRLDLGKTHALDALCVGEVAAVTAAGQAVLGIKATGRGQHLRSRFDRYGFPRGYCLRRKRVRGFATGDQVAAVVPAGKHAGTHRGRVAVRATGSFRVGTVDGISWRACRLLARGDGYEYALRPGRAVANNTLKGGRGSAPGINAGVSAALIV
ncbi:MAG TPA: HNH endonuclease, partial [Chloroflexia bacterium]|nr:HNH endonuclease [Chloroflexia bacterium]